MQITTDIAAAAKVAPAQVGAGRTVHYVRTDGFHAAAEGCNRRVTTVLDDRAAAKMGRECASCVKAVQALAAAAAPAPAAPVADEPAITVTPALPAGIEVSTEASAPGIVFITRDGFHFGFVRNEGDQYVAWATAGAIGTDGRVGSYADRDEAIHAVLATHPAAKDDVTTPAATAACVHGREPRADVTGDPVAACATAAHGTDWGAFSPSEGEGAWYVDGCAVEAANEAARENQELEAESDEPAAVWGAVCTEHAELPAGTCSECNVEGADDEDGDEDDEDVPAAAADEEVFTPAAFDAFQQGDRIRFVTAGNGFDGIGQFWRTGTVTRATGRSLLIDCDSNALSSRGVVQRSTAHYRALHKGNQATPAAEATPAAAAPAAPAGGRFYAEVERRLAYPGHTEDRYTVCRVGDDTPELYVALPADNDRRAADVLAAFGWALTDGLEYIAGPNLERGPVAATEPADTPLADELRAAVRREVVARTTALADHAGARHFRAVMPEDGGAYPIGWTYRTLYGEAAQYGWVTAAGRGMTRTGVPTREDAERIIRDWTAAGTADALHPGIVQVIADLPTDRVAEMATVIDRVTVAEPTPAEAAMTPEEARAAVAVAYFNARDFQPVRGRDGALLGYTFAADRRFGWVTVAGTYTHALEPYRSYAADLLPEAAAQDARHGRILPEQSRRDAVTRAEHERTAAVALVAAVGDRIACTDGTVRTVRAADPAGEGARVTTEDGTQWTVDQFRRITPETIHAARDAMSRAAVRVRQNPNPSDPEWCAALDTLGREIDYLKAADPVTRPGLIEDEAHAVASKAHADAHDFEPFTDGGLIVGWSFRTGYGAGARYGVVTVEPAVSPAGLYEYRTTAVRAHLYGGA